MTCLLLLEAAERATVVTVVVARRKDAATIKVEAVGVGLVRECRTRPTIATLTSGAEVAAVQVDAAAAHGETAYF